MKTIKIQCPAKINLTLEVLDERSDGFHNLKSIMQTISLYDNLTITVEDRNTEYHPKLDSRSFEVVLSGTSDKIPYDSKNLVYKAAMKFLEAADIKDKKISIHIEKNIPVEAGLAGGSTDAAGTFYGLNRLFNNPLSKEKLEELCASLGSDLNFCLNGGTALCTSRGEETKKLSTPDLDITLIKPTGFGISAKEAYSKFSKMSDKSVPNNTDKMAELLNKGGFDNSLLYNSLENAVIDDYQELRFIKSTVENSMMSGSGPTFFTLSKNIDVDFDKKKFVVIDNLKTTQHGVTAIQ